MHERAKIHLRSCDQTALLVIFADLYNHFLAVMRISRTVYNYVHDINFYYFCIIYSSDFISRQFPLILEENHFTITEKQ